MSKQVKIILASCFYIIGILVFFSQNLLFLSIFIFLLILACLYKKFFTVKYSLILCFIFMSGLLNVYSHINYFDDLSEFSDEVVTVKAHVSTIPSNNDETKTGFFADVYSVSLDGTGFKDIKAKSRITITDEIKNYSKIKIGDNVKLKGKVKIPATAQNPSQFDYAKYLQFKNTFTLLYVEKDWEILSGSDTLSGQILSRLNDKRNSIINIHAGNIKAPMIDILGGIIFGDDAVNPDNETKTSFINSGIFHILAASGMNVTLIFGIWFFFAKNLRLNYRLSIITGILLILFYTCMTGFGPPIIRATLMLTLILIGKLLDKTTPTLAMLFLVAFLMLLFNPLMVFDIGFQLSFIVTFALILTAPLLSFNFRFKPFNYILGGCCIPIIAQIFAAPLQMYYFNTFTMYSVFANIAIIPVLSIVSFVGFISSILAFVSCIADKICLIADYILNPLLIYIVKVANFFANLPNSIIYLRKPSVLQIVLYFSIIILVISLLKLKYDSSFFENSETKNSLKFLSGRNKKYYAVLLSLIMIFIFTFLPLKSKNPEIIIFSVGNADAILLKSCSQEYFLIDSGKKPYKNQTSQAKNIIIKYLKDKGIKNIYAYIITHFDADHAGGSIDLLENLNIEKVYISDTYEDTMLSEDINSYLNKNKIVPYIVNEEQEIFSDEDFSLSLIKPNGKDVKSENQKSIIVKASYKGNNILFMGDGDENSYNALPDNFKENIVILKAGHHGALNTLNKDMLKNTQLTVISTGANVYGHPNRQTIDILENNNKVYLRTDYHNAIKIIMRKNGFDKYTYTSKNKKFIKYR